MIVVNNKSEHRKAENKPKDRKQRVTESQSKRSFDECDYLFMFSLQYLLVSNKWASLASPTRLLLFVTAYRSSVTTWRTIRGLGEIDSKVNSAHIVSIRHDYKPVYDCCGARSWFVALGTLGTIYAEVFSVELSYRIFRQDPSVLKTVVDLNQSFDAKRASSTSTGDAAESPYKSKT